MSSEMAVIGPSPGNTPTSVPVNTPKNANPKFAGVNACANPSPSSVNTSLTPAPNSEVPPAARPSIAQ